MPEPKQSPVSGSVDVGSYRPVPDADSDFQKGMESLPIKEADCVEGESEKMLSDDKKMKTDLADVKFINDQQNGDTKIDILEMKQAFTGLTKEELMKYCNDPFWVRMRWCMFILFWLIWFGMLAGAIYIIIVANKCAPPPPKTWWEEGPVIDLGEDGLTDFENTGNLFKSVIIPHPFNEDAYSLNPSENENYAKFMTSAKEQNLKVIVDIEPNNVHANHPWFTASESGNDTYSNYFIWRKGTSEAPPNNWVSMVNDKAWQYSDKRKEWYLSSLNKDMPDLNFRDPKVVDEFKHVIKKWIDSGASGFRLSKAKHLLVSDKFEDEEKADTHGAVFNEYNYWNHLYTVNQDGVAQVIKQWKDYVLNLTDGQGVLTLKEDLSQKDAAALKIDNKLIVDLPRSSQALMKDPSVLNATNLNHIVNNAFKAFGNESWPSWQFNSQGHNVESEFRIITSLLPGTGIVTKNQVTISTENSTSFDNQYKALISLRSNPSILYGGYNSSLFEPDIFCYTRLKSGNPGVVVLYNAGSKNASADITKLHKMPSDVTVSLLSANYDIPDVNVKAKLSARDVMVSAKSAIVLTYVPEE